MLPGFQRMLPVLTCVCVGVCCYTLAKEGRVVRLNRVYCLPAFLRLALTWVLCMFRMSLLLLLILLSFRRFNGGKHTGGGVELK